MTANLEQNRLDKWNIGLTEVVTNLLTDKK